MVIVRKELWKEKARIVARDERGQILSWSSKIIPVQRAKEIFKKNNTFKKGFRVERLTNVKEIIDNRPRARPPTKLPFQVLYEVKIGNKVITARSMQGTNLQKLDRDAQENISARISGSLNISYDDDELDSLFAQYNNKFKLKRSIVYYKKLKK